MERTGQDVMQRAGQDGTGWDSVTCQPHCLHTRSSFPFSNNQALLNNLDTSINVLN